MDERRRQYDRQLRLWGEAGQRALEAAHVCLVGATALGSEAAKSLVLPGVGSLTVVDDADVTAAHVSADFALESSSVGKSRAHETLRGLLEMNPAVRGFAVAESPDRLVDDRPDFFDAFSAVVACDLPERTLVRLADHLWRVDVPLLVCRSVGFLSALRVQVREHRVVDSHPDDETPDLRLRDPFPQLADYVNSYDLAEMDPKDRGHLPWLALVAHAAADWSRAHEGRWPTTRAEKDQVKQGIRATCGGGGGEEEENVREALRAVNVALVDAPLPKRTRDILYDDACVNLSSKSSPFWIVNAAIRQFVEEEGLGRPPVRGSIPDMTASTERYVALQNVYRAKAAADAEAVHARVVRIVGELGAEPISEADVRAACKNATHVRVVRGTPLSVEYDGTVNAYVARRLEEGDPMMVHYAVLRAAERFRAEQCRHAGEWDPEADVPKLKACAARLLAEWSCPPLADDDRIREMCRYGGAELHSVSAFMGGCVAQEVIKIITEQYAPLDNFFIHDATTTASATFTF